MTSPRRWHVDPHGVAISPDIVMSHGEIAARLADCGSLAVHQQDGRTARLLLTTVYALQEQLVGRPGPHYDDLRAGLDQLAERVRSWHVI